MDRIVELYLLQRGGYPFRREDLAREEWIALGVVREEADEARAAAHPTLELRPQLRAAE